LWDAEVTVCLHVSHFSDAPLQREHSDSARACFSSVVAPVVFSHSHDAQNQDAFGRHWQAPHGAEAGGDSAAVAVADDDG
jgi:hypothetical protein